jgi:hypothetical protein
VPLKLTLLVALRFVPVIVTVVPAGPLVGLKPLIVGGLMTVKPPALVALPSAVVTVTEPLVAPVGTVALIWVSLVTV